MSRDRQLALDPEEDLYIHEKTAASVEDWRSYLENLNLKGFDIDKFVPASKNALPGITVPVVGITASGGAQRSSPVDRRVTRKISCSSRIGPLFLAGP